MKVISFLILTIVLLVGCQTSDPVTSKTFHKVIRFDDHMGGLDLTDAPVTEVIVHLKKMSDEAIKTVVDETFSKKIKTFEFVLPVGKSIIKDGLCTVTIHFPTEIGFKTKFACLFDEDLSIEEETMSIRSCFTPETIRFIEVKQSRPDEAAARKISLFI